MSIYSVRKSYALGDKYLKEGNHLAAEVCYAFPMIEDHKANAKELGNINPQKLYALKRISYKAPARGKEMGNLLSFVRSFYRDWHEEIVKPAMRTRAKIHAQFRKQAVIKVFNETIRNDNIAAKLNIDALNQITLQNQNRQLHKIMLWEGPNFSKLQYCTKKSVLKTNKAKKISKLTVVMDQKLYRKRCLNSQEDWFKKFDGEFFALCLKEILKVLNAYFENQDDRKFMKLKFVKNILEKQIQFKHASPKLLIPAGTLFASKDLMKVLNKFHPKLDALSIKKEAGSAVRPKHKKLMDIINTEYSKMDGDEDISDDDISNDDKSVPYTYDETDVPPEIITPPVSVVTSPSPVNRPVAPPLPPFPTDELKTDEIKMDGLTIPVNNDEFGWMQDNVTAIMDNHDINEINDNNMENNQDMMPVLPSLPPIPRMLNFGFMHDVTPSVCGNEDVEEIVGNENNYAYGNQSYGYGTDNQINNAIYTQGPGLPYNQHNTFYSNNMNHNYRQHTVPAQLLTNSPFTGNDSLMDTESMNTRNDFATSAISTISTIPIPTVPRIPTIPIMTAIPQAQSYNDNMPTSLPSLSPGTQMTVQSNASMVPPCSGQSSLYSLPQPYACDSTVYDVGSGINTFPETDTVQPSLMNVICPQCDELECRCNWTNNNNFSTIHHDNLNERQFQSTYNFMDRSHRVHHQINSRTIFNRDQRNQRRFNHIQQMRTMQ